MHVIVVRPLPDHRHCDLCYSCLYEGTLQVLFRAPNIYIERDDGRAPDCYEAGEWLACLDCAVAIEEHDVEAIVERMINLNRRLFHPSQEQMVRRDFARLVQAFDELRVDA